MGTEDSSSAVKAESADAAAKTPIKADPDAAPSPMVVDTSASPAAPIPSVPSQLMAELPKNRFELELEFVQSLASPAYLHYLATNPSSDDHNWLDDPEFIEFLRYLLRVWSRPEYNIYLVYPQSLYFLEWMLNHRREEWAQVGFRNFAHQQQFMSWQHRASKLYGRGSTVPVAPEQMPAAAADPDTQAQHLQQQQQGPTLDPQTGMEIEP